MRSKAVGHQRLVVAQIADERVGLDELELVLRGRSLEQALEFPQAPGAVSAGQLAGGFQLAGACLSASGKKPCKTRMPCGPRFFIIASAQLPVCGPISRERSSSQSSPCSMAARLRRGCGRDRW